MSKETKDCPDKEAPPPPDAVLPTDRKSFPGISRDQIEGLIRSYEKTSEEIRKLSSSSNGASRYRKFRSKVKKSNGVFWETVEEAERESREKVAAVMIECKKECFAGTSAADLAASGIRQSREILTLWASYKAILQTGTPDMICLWMRNLTGPESFLLSVILSKPSTQAIQ